jgi:hypothetical protein
MSIFFNVKGTMGGRIGLLFVVVLGVALACDARGLLANPYQWGIIAANSASSGNIFDSNHFYFNLIILLRHENIMETCLVHSILNLPFY